MKYLTQENNMNKKTIEVIAALKFYSFKIGIAEAEYQSTLDFLSENFNDLPEELQEAAQENLKFLKEQLNDLRKLLPEE